VLTGTIETKGARARRDIPEDYLGGVGGHHLPIIDVEPTDAKVNIKQQGPGPLLHDVNPKHVEVWGDPGPEKWAGMSDRPP